jgi:hypothetical protein
MMRGDIHPSAVLQRQRKPFSMSKTLAGFGQHQITSLKTRTDRTLSRHFEGS